MAIKIGTAKISQATGRIDQGRMKQVRTDLIFNKGCIT